MTETNFFQALPLTTFDSAGLTGTLAALNGTGTEDVCKVIKMINASDVDITLSYDGTNNHDIILANTQFIVDLRTNAEGVQGGRGHWAMRENQIIYGSGSAGTGNFYFIGYF